MNTANLTYASFCFFFSCFRHIEYSFRAVRNRSPTSQRPADKRQAWNQQLFRHHRTRQGEVHDVGQGEGTGSCGMARGVRTVSIDAGI